MSQMEFEKNIQTAEHAIQEKREMVKMGKLRQRYHFMAESGWINDPNGLIYFRGQYHLFYQFNPYEPVWGEMHWGHAVSSDLFHWTHLPVALAPSEPYDSYERGGCFSGTAIEYEGRLYLFYTGTGKDADGGVQTQCLAVSEDGITFKKYDKNPVIKVPDGYQACDFRDPKVWEHEGKFYLICGAKKDGYARLLLFRSDDLKHWEFFGVMAESRGEWGEMWECPDFYTLDGTDVLSFSPIGVGERKTIYMTGKMNYETGKFQCLKDGEADWGFDFYAPQTLKDEKGRRIMIGWAGSWDWMPWWKGHGPSEKEGWSGFFGLPREVRTAENGALRFLPVEEVKLLRSKELLDRTEAVTEAGEPLKLPEADIYELNLTVDRERTTAASCILKLRGGNGRHTGLILDLKNMELKVDRNCSDGESCGVSRSVIYPENPKTLDIRVFMDRCSVEVFANGGKNVHTCRIYPAESQRENCLESVGGRLVVTGLQMWALAGTQK